MGKRTMHAVVLAGLIAGLGVASFALAGDGQRGVLGSRLSGFFEVPAVSTTGTGVFHARVAPDGESIGWTLSYSDLEAPAFMAHIHFGQAAVNGGVSVWLCGDPATTPATQACPPTGGTISGTATAADVVGPAGQGIAAGELDELLDAIRAGRAYVNVHTSMFPGGEVRGQISRGIGVDGRGGPPGDD